MDIERNRWHMNYYEQYKQKLKTPEEAIKVIKDGDWIDYSVGLGYPPLLDQALAAHKEDYKDVKIRGYLMLQPVEAVEADPEREHFIYNSWYMSGIERKLSDRGLANFMPMVFRNLPSYYRRYLKVNVAMMSVTPMDDKGYFNFSLSNPNARAVMDVADYIILEVNENLPYVYGEDNQVHISEIDAIVEGEHGPLPNLPTPAATEIDEKIGDIILNEMVDGSCIQLGIGGLANCVGQKIAQSDLKDIGVHTELLADAYLDLHNAGKITNKAKNIDTGKTVYGIVLGSQGLYDWCADNETHSTRDIAYCNSPEIISKIDNFVSINNCVNVDLKGQINAESAGTRHISGTGGQLDFLTGAYMSEGGKAFICMTSSYTDKEGNLKSRFVPHFNGDAITDPRSQAFYLVTEYGMANLAGRTDWERAEAMINIAHPDHRDDLIKEAEKLGVWIKSNKR